LTISREERGLKTVTEIATETLRVVRAIAVNLEGPSRSLGGLPVAGPLRHQSLEVSQQTHTEFFSSQKLRELSEAYIQNVHILHPMFDAPEKMCHVFIEQYGDNAAIPGSVIPSLRNANVLLLLALGSFKSISDDTKCSSTIPGMVYYSYVQGILARKCEENSFALAQTKTLAALYNNQIGMLRESWGNISCAHRIYKNLSS
jgi:hypothetical protein